MQDVVLKWRKGGGGGGTLGTAAPATGAAPGSLAERVASLAKLGASRPGSAPRPAGPEASLLGPSDPRSALV